MNKGNSCLEKFDEKQENELLGFVTERFGREVFTPGLERTRPLYLPFIQHFLKTKTKIIIIGGTNGKGQTAHTLTSLLLKQGRSVGLWTSPHILSVRERFCFNHQEVSYVELREAMLEGQKRLESETPSLKVSFYEFLFMVFLQMAAQKESLDYLVLEVGLGGKLDAVNHFDCDGAAITSISRDHQAILGNRYDLILSEKLGIGRKGKPLFTQLKLDYLNAQVRDYATLHGIIWKKIEANEESDDYFLENQRMASELFLYFESTPAFDLSKQMSEISPYKGRREIMTFQGKSLIFIGAHNIDGIRRMLAGFEEGNLGMIPDSLLVSFSDRPSSEIEVMLRSLTETFSRTTIKVSQFEHPKAFNGFDLEVMCKKANKGMLNFVSDWQEDLKNSESQTILVCGSYYFIGEVQRFISR